MSPERWRHIEELYHSARDIGFVWLSVKLRGDAE
jgi:hypothetical protein